MSDPISRARRPQAAARPLSTAAALGGALAAGVTLLVCLALGLTAWFLADAGAHGDTTDALRAGADAWLMGHGSRLELAGLPLGITPLALTMGLVLGAFRGGRWAGRHAVGVKDDRVLATATAAFTGVYVVIAVLVCVLATRTGATPGLGRTVLGALLVAVLAGGLGLAVSTGRFAAWSARATPPARELVTGALVATLALVAAGAVLAATSLLFSFNEASSVFSSLDLSTGDALTFTVVMALAAPNVVLLGCSYLLGTGFAVGVGTTVAPTAAVKLGAVPAIPVLAALPAEGHTARWLVAVMLVPVVAAALGTVYAHRYGEPLAYDKAALRGGATGLVAALLVTIAISLAGGPLGTGRLADIGASTGEVLRAAVVTMTVGGALAGLVQAWWQRREPSSSRSR